MRHGGRRVTLVRNAGSESSPRYLFFCVRVPDAGFVAALILLKYGNSQMVILSKHPRSRARMRERHGHAMAADKRRRRLRFEVLEQRQLLSAVSWTGNGGNSNWDNPQNWNSQAIPGPGDDVTIDTGATAATVVIQAVNAESVNSLATGANDTLSITGGSLSVTANSTLSGALSMTGGSLTASGANVAVVVNGATSITNAFLTAEAGATLNLSNLSSYSDTDGNFETLLATGTGSSLVLSGLTSLSENVTTGDFLTIEAESGGNVNLSALTQISTGPVDLVSDGAGERDRRFRPDLLLPQQRQPERFAPERQRRRNDRERSVDDHGRRGPLPGRRQHVVHRPVDQLHRGDHDRQRQRLSLTLSNLTDLDYASVTVENGATLSIPIVSYTGTGGSSSSSSGGGESGDVRKAFASGGGSSGNTSFTTLEATGQGSTLTLSNLANLDGGNVEALSGGTVILSDLTQINQGTVDLVSDGTGSLLNVSALTSLAAGSGDLDSLLQATNGGTIQDPDLASLNAVNVTADGASTLSIAQITSYSTGNLTVSDGTFAFSGLTTFNDVSATVEEGATLNLPASFTGTVAAIDATDGGTVNVGNTSALTMPPPGTGGVIDVNLPPLLAGVPVSLATSGTYTGATFDIAPGDSRRDQQRNFRRRNCFQYWSRRLLHHLRRHFQRRAPRSTSARGPPPISPAAEELSYYSGTLTGSGSGTVLLQSGRLYVGIGGMTLDFSGGTFQWTSGVIDGGLGTLTNLGTINLPGIYDKYFFNDGTLDNFGTILQTGSGSFDLGTDNIFNVTLDNETSGLWLIESNGGLNPYEDGLGDTGLPTIINAGTIRKTASYGTSDLDLDGPLTNTGTIETDSGTLWLNDVTLPQLSAGTLSGGVWKAINGATLQFPSGSSITTNAASITLSGVSASLSALGALAANSGSLNILGAPPSPPWEGWPTAAASPLADRWMSTGALSRPPPAR